MMHKPATMRLSEIRAHVLHGGGHGHGGHGGGHGHGGNPPGHFPPFSGPFHGEHIPHVEGANPLMDDYMRPGNTQNFDVMPENEGKRTMPVYLPATAEGIQDNGKPINSVNVLTRAALMDDVLNEDYKNGSPAAIYRAYFMAWLCVGLTVLALGINVYLAAVMAYLAGYYWSEKDLSVGWSVQWWKGKTLTHTT